MQSRGELLVLAHRLVASQNEEEAGKIRDQLGKVADGFVENFADFDAGVTRTELEPGMLPPGSGFPVSALTDEQLQLLNALLPWAAPTVDESGRQFGSAWSSKKRAKVQALDQIRHERFDEVYPFKGKRVLEVGCFEGIHTISMLSRGAAVTAIDSRMENLLKTLTRLWAYGFTADVELWDLELPEIPASIPEEWDVLHHIGVLYHLADPIRHLKAVLPRTKGALLLDTHIAADEESAKRSYEVDGRTYRYYHHGENTVQPFAGMLDHAKWMLLSDLEDLLKEQGFTDVQVKSNRVERNGRRITLWAFRPD